MTNLNRLIGGPCEEDRGPVPTAHAAPQLTVEAQLAIACEQKRLGDVSQAEAIKSLTRMRKMAVNDLLKS